MTLKAAADLDPLSCDAIIICQMNVEEQSAKSIEDASTTLLAKVGCDRRHDPLEQLRIDYRRALQAARSVVMLQRSLTARDAEPLYPSTLFQETMDCYRSSLTDTAEMDSDLDVPQSFLPYVSQLAETRFVYTATGKDDQLTAFSEPWPITGHLSDESRPLIALPRSAETASLPGMDLSPSLECPYQWFVKRRLSLSAPDEGFGGMERGNFVHRLLQQFYQELHGLGWKRVTEENVDQAQNLMADLFDRFIDEQPERRAGDRYVWINEWEREMVRSLKLPLLEYIGREAHFLPEYEPTHFEWVYGQDQPVQYAGNRLVGTVDRIDVDQKGHAVVIDYKTGMGVDYSLHGAKQKEFRLPRKMQALMYSRVVQDELDVQVVGALYLNPLTGAIRGAYDKRYLDPKWMEGIHKDNDSVPFDTVQTFDDLLTVTEQQVSDRLVDLADGDIHPKPYDKAVCRYCPAVLCEERLA